MSNFAGQPISTRRSAIQSADHPTSYQLEHRHLSAVKDFAHNRAFSLSFFQRPQYQFGCRPRWGLLSSNGGGEDIAQLTADDARLWSCYKPQHFGTRVEGPSLWRP